MVQLAWRRIGQIDVINWAWPSNDQVINPEFFETACCADRRSTGEGDDRSSHGSFVVLTEDVDDLSSEQSHKTRARFSHRHGKMGRQSVPAHSLWCAREREFTSE